MSTPTRIVTPEEREHLNEVTGVFVAQLEIYLQAVYALQDGNIPFEAMPVYSRMGAVIITAVQSLLAPEPFGVPRMPLDPMIKAIGMAIGCQTANTTQEEFERLMIMFGEGVGIGRAETHNAAINMPTAGRA